MTSRIKPGDAVRLKSSNIEMTVRRIVTKISTYGTNMLTHNYECIWYEKSKLQKAIFHKNSLEQVAPYYDNLHFANYE